MEISRRGFLAYGTLTGLALCTASAPGTAFGAPPPARASALPAAAATDVEARAAALSPPVFLLETRLPRQFSASRGDRLALSEARAKVGTRSLRWEHTPGGVLTIAEPLRYAASAYTPGTDQALMGTVGTFAVWIYNGIPSAGPLRIEFGRGSTTDAWFDFGLDFTGWRTCWVRLGYDTQGRPHHGMNRVRLVAPDRAGTLFVDQVVLNTLMRPDHPTPDAQVPFVQAELETADNRHWLDLLRFRAEYAQAVLPATDGAADLPKVRAALVKGATEATDVTAAGLAAATAAVEALRVPERGAEAPAGSGSFVNGYQSAIWPTSIRTDVAALAGVVPLRELGKRMRQVASAWAEAGAEGASTRDGFAELYLRMFLHLEDQGFADGSAQGTIHHIGYQYREMSDSFLVAQPLLAQHGLWTRALKNLRWFTGLGRITHDFSDPADFGGVVDVQNTLLSAMAVCAVHEDTPDAQARTLAAITRWTENSLTLSPGVEGGLKPDGTIFHHMGPYPDYARDALSGMAPTVALLHGTAFALGRPAREALRTALLTQRLHANTMQWPLALSGRHPTGVTGLVLSPYQRMATVPMPGEKGKYDPQMAAAFLRLLPAGATASQRKLAADLNAAGISAESTPSGHWALGYAACGLHRRDEWLVTLRGHNRYLWSAEIYETDNLYGRYLSYASVEVQAAADDSGQITHAANGFVQPGWDWNRIPGTTAKQLPFELLRADLTGTIEQMPLTRSRFGGAGSWQGRHGVFGMRLMEHPKFDATHTAKLSRFSFDEVVVCLGSDIGNSDGEHATETTLYQVALGGAASGSDQRRTLTADAAIADPLGHGYFVPAGQMLRRISALQTAPDQGGTTTAAHPFETVVIEHGCAPSGAHYEYALLVGSGARGAEDFAARMSGDQAPYRVLRKDASAHVVKAGGVTGAVCFAPTRDLDGLVREVDTPGLLMWGRDGADLLLSVTDPDLHLYDGEDPEQFDSRGRYVGDKTSYSRPWRRNPSAPSVLTVTLAGVWVCAAPEVTAQHRDGATILAVTCRDAQTRDLRLTAG
jgi:chondroitin-sulfate-ABC endolyase/exolyase